MQFLAPLFLLALAGLAIPVLLHLTQREKKQVVRFPSLMFVRRIPYQSVRRRKLHNLLLLCIRLAALALIVAAFARPLVLRSSAVPPGGTGAREVVVLLDGSYSMGYGDRWERARAAALDVVNRLSSSDRASLVVFSSGAEIAVRSSPERDRISAAVTAARPGSGATRFAPALKVAGGILGESTLPRREVVLVSDFQRSGWRGEEGSRLPAGTVFTPVVVEGEASRPNVSVTAVSLARSTFSNQERVTVTAGLVNRTELPVSGMTLTLEVGGIPVATRPVTMEPGAAASLAFDPVTISVRNMRGTVRLSEDALAADNAFHFVASPAVPVRLLVVERGGPGALFLSRAVSIGESPRFEAVTRAADAVSDDDLRRSAVVVLNDVEVGPPLARRLSRFVEAGGGLFVVAGSRATWPQDVDLLPGTIGNPVDRTRGTPSRVGTIEFGHPVFEPFRAPRSGNFAIARVYGYRAIAPGPGAQVIARFDGGAPAVLERRVGTGRVLLWASSVDNVWNDLPIRGVFLPFVHQAMRHLSGYREPQPWLLVGQVLDTTAAVAPRTAASSRVVLTPSGRRVPLDDEGGEVLELTEQGFYEIRTGETELAVVASNVDPLEADLTPMDPREIAAAAAGEADGPDRGPAPGVPLTPEAQEQHQRLWWWLLCLGILLLGVDTVLSNRLAKSEYPTR